MRSFYSSVARDTLGVGIGLRSPHVTQILKDLPSIDWFELLADNHIVAGGVLEGVRGDRRLPGVVDQLKADGDPFLLGVQARRCECPQHHSDDRQPGTDGGCGVYGRLPGVSAAERRLASASTPFSQEKAS